MTTPRSCKRNSRKLPILHRTTLNFELAKPRMKPRRDLLRVRLLNLGELFQHLLQPPDQAAMATKCLAPQRTLPRLKLLDLSKPSQHHLQRSPDRIAMAWMCRFQLGSHVSNVWRKNPLKEALLSAMHPLSATNPRLLQVLQEYLSGEPMELQDQQTELRRSRPYPEQRKLHVVQAAQMLP